VAKNLAPRRRGRGLRCRRVRADLPDRAVPHLQRTGLRQPPILRPTLPAMKALRRGLIVAVIAVLVGGFVKLRGKGGVPPTSGGWRELDGPEFR
jgi:hypothetical protein